MKALSYITVCGERYKHGFDKIKTGRMIGGADKNLAGSFLLWRGAPMKEEWIKPYVDSIGHGHVRLPGNTSCSRDPRIGIDFATG